MIAGFDFNTTAIDVVLLDEDTNKATWHHIAIDTGKGDPFDHALRVRDLMPARAGWKDEGVTAIGIERPWARHLKSIAPLMRVQGAILACLPRDIEIFELHPQRWKKLTVGKSNAAKVDVAAWARGELAAAYSATLELAWNQDAFDAYAIARATRRLINEREATKGAAA